MRWDGGERGGRDDGLSLRCLGGIQVETAKGKKCRCGVFPITGPLDLLKVQLAIFSLDFQSSTYLTY